MFRKAAHLYDPQAGAPGWNDPRWGLEGYDPAVSIYDQDFGRSDSNIRRIVKDGMIRLLSRQPLSAPTMTRSGRVSAQHNTLPAARFFNQLGGAAGTGQAFSPAMVAQGQRSLRLGWNPNMQGAAELHPPTSYDPFPSPSSLYPKVV